MENENKMTAEKILKAHIRLAELFTGEYIRDGIEKEKSFISAINAMHEFSSRQNSDNLKRIEELNFANKELQSKHKFSQDLINEQDAEIKEAVALIKEKDVWLDRLVEKDLKREETELRLRKEIDESRDLFSVLDSLGGLGFDKHRWIRERIQKNLDTLNETF